MEEWQRLEFQNEDGDTYVSDFLLVENKSGEAIVMLLEDPRKFDETSILNEINAIQQQILKERKASFVIWDTLGGREEGRFWLVSIRDQTPAEKQTIEYDLLGQMLKRGIISRGKTMDWKLLGADKDKAIEMALRTQIVEDIGL